MEQHFTYYADLQGISLNDAGRGTWVHALPLGEYNHPIHGKLSFNTDRIKRFVQSVKNRVLGIDPDIDYDHKMDPAHGKKAAGWVKDAEARSNGLWLLVEWTEAARQAITNREYRYFSTEYVDEMEDNQGNKLMDVVRGGGLTNRPFMKNLVPINLSELGAEANPSAKENKMDRKELAKLLGLGEDATDEQIKSAIEAKNNKVDLSKAEVTVAEDGTIKVTHPEAEGTVEHKVEAPKLEDKTTEPTEAEIEELRKTSPALAAMLTETIENNKKLSDDFKQMVATQRLTDLGTQLSEVGGAQKVQISPAVRTKLSQVLVRLPKELSDDVVSALEELTKDTGLVQLGEVVPNGGGPNNGGNGKGANPVKQFTEAVDKLRENDEKLSYREAVELATHEDPELFERYQDAVAQGVTLSD